MAQVYWSSSEHKLPTRRVALFDSASQALYSLRESFWNRVSIPPLRLNRALGAVAAYLHSHEVTGFAEEGKVRAQLATVLYEPEQVDAVLKAAREVSGFLVARGEGVYGFLHRSLQEYFAAKYLTDQPEYVATNISTYLLYPVWREPIVLAIGMVSQRKYPDSLRYLAEVFAAVLNTPDPSGDFLPHRELLAAAACVECERVPSSAVRRLAERLLNLYSQQDGRNKSPVLLERICRAFVALRASPAKDEVEETLCM